ncbi:MAG: hypothetical protein J7K47_04135, partial [Thermoplasmata archaeon]|nr:hypothetical protein [Thermoplasmata archaeon]
IWNISKTSGINIVGGVYLGGNYWSDYDGIDLNNDGIGDTNLPYNCSGDIQHGGDYASLTFKRYTLINITPCYQWVNLNETFIVNITIDPVVAIAGVQCDLLFNASLLEVISVEEGDLFNGYPTFFNNGSIDNTNGIINDMYIAITMPGGSASDAGTFVKITFKAKKEGTSYLNVTDAAIGDINAQPVAIKIGNGSVEVIIHPWDVNRDDIINILDLIIIGQHFGSHEGEENYAKEADLNNDGMINILDLIIVAMHFGESY